MGTGPAGDCPRPGGPVPAVPGAAPAVAALLRALDADGAGGADPARALRLLREAAGALPGVLEAEAAEGDAAGAERGADPTGSVPGPETVVLPVTSRGRVWGHLVLRTAPLRAAGTDDPPPADAAGRGPGAAARETAAALAEATAVFLGLAADRADAVRAQQALAHQALHDSLTGLANRTLLLDRLDHELHSGARRRTPLAVIFCDLDRFKEVNDEVGHAGGDELLRQVARRLTGVLRAQDTVARLGGDEFVAVCGDLPRDLAEDALRRHVDALAERLAAAVAAPGYPLDGAEVEITASVGAVVAGPGMATAEALLRDADAAMYREKRRRGARRTIDLRVPPAAAGREGQPPR